MVATVGSISIDLSTNTNAFASGFKANATTVEQQSARMAKSIAAIEERTALAGERFKEFGTVLATGTGIATVLSLEAAFDKLKETISEYDEISKDAKTAGLSTDTYQALGFAAKQANIDQETFNSSLDIFAKNAGLAVRGTGALYSGLKTLNPQLLQNIINTKDQEERLKLVADAMANTTDATQKAALATVIFGRGGVDMARILEQGRASIDRFKQTAKDLGIIVPEELLSKAGELDEKLKVLSAVISHNLGEALINAAPMLVELTTEVASFAKQINAGSEALTNFVNSPSWANLEKLVVAIGGKPFLENSLLGRLASGETGLASSASDIAQVTNAIDFMRTKITELQDEAAKGIDVHVELADAKESLTDLEARLVKLQGVGVSAANAIRAGFAEAFRTAENSSMDALASLQGARAPGSLPNVTRYGGDPNKIVLPQERYNEQTNVNGSGVNVRSYGADPSLKGIDTTAKYTQQTSDNVSKLDANTKKYLESLSSDIGGYAAQTNVTINSLSDVTASTAKYLSTSILAALVQKNDTADGSLANNGFLTHDQVFIPGMTSYARNIGAIHLPPTTSDGTSNTSVNVQQPGTSITLNYVASPNESEATAKQRARDMFNELVRAQASA